MRGLCENCCAHHVPWSPPKLWRSNYIFNLWIGTYRLPRSPVMTHREKKSCEKGKEHGLSRWWSGVLVGRSRFKGMSISVGFFNTLSGWSGYAYKRRRSIDADKGTWIGQGTIRIKLNIKKVMKNIVFIDQANLITILSKSKFIYHDLKEKE